MSLEIKPSSEMKPSKEHSDYEKITDYDEDGDVFVAIKPCYDNSTQWFKATQNGAVQNDKRELYRWFHGFITRRQAEEILTDKPTGSFLIRVSETQLGYSLSLRVKGRCKHYLIKPLNSGKYAFSGGAKVHSSLQELVNYHRKNVIYDADGDILIQHCTPKDKVVL